MFPLYVIACILTIPSPLSHQALAWVVLCLVLLRNERRMLSLYHQQGSCAVLGPLFVFVWSYKTFYMTIAQSLGTLATRYYDHRYVLPPPDIRSYIMVHRLLLSAYREAVPIRRTWHGNF